MNSIINALIVCFAFLTTSIYRIVLFICWIAGIIIAKGFWSTLFAFFIPFWSWYLVIEKIFIYYGVVN